MITVEKLTKCYGDKSVLTDFSATFQKNTFTVLSAPSGAGKTTLLRILCGLEQADSGSVTGMPPDPGMVFQEPRLFGHLSALDNVALVSDRACAKEVLCALGLEDALAKRPVELSGGMAQRVAIARAIASGRTFLLLDEPFRGLDEACKAQVMEYVKSNVSGGILVTHNLEEAVFFGGKSITL